jgi:hypothetical protein
MRKKDFVTFDWEVNLPFLCSSGVHYYNCEKNFKKGIDKSQKIWYNKVYQKGEVKENEKDKITLA